MSLLETNRGFALSRLIDVKYWKYDAIVKDGELIVDGKPLTREQLDADWAEFGDEIETELTSFEKQKQLIESDNAFIRVIEDLIDTLVSKGVIKKTDLPEAAQTKYDERKNLRK